MPTFHNQQYTVEFVKNRLEELTDDEGYDSVMEMLADRLVDGAVPGACMGCDTTIEIEPDSDDGWCPECHSNKVVSCFRLAGLI